ncbi:MAG: tetratricopeptide repeat protein, partial [Anaerolineales bacterium]|nr:tetratricopeptide repeat protein [Anaerolineales bacterium]
SQTTDDTRKIAADSQRNLGIISVDLGQLDAAKSYYLDALAAYQKIRDQIGTTTTLNNLGVLYWNLGDFQEARKFYQDALTLYRQMGQRKGEGMVLGNLATLLMAYGDYANALTYNQSALFILKETGSKLGQCYAYLNLGLTHLYGAEYENALQNSKLALHIAQEIGGLRFRGYALINLGHVLHAQGKLNEAEKSYRDALSVWHDMEQANLAVESRAGIAAVTLQAGKLPDALTQVDVIMRYLKQGNTLAGTEDPFKIYLTCYEVLTAVSDPRADQMLQTAYDQLQEQAMHIQDKETRHAFLNNVHNHQKLISLHKKLRHKQTKAYL